MSQDASTQSIPSNASRDFISGQFRSVESYADNLMDELFEDIDQVLEGGSPLPSESVRPEYISLEPIAVPKLALPPAIARDLRNLALQHRGGPIQRAITQDPSPNEKSVPTDPVKSSHWLGDFWSSGQFMDKLLLVATCASLIFALFLWLVSQVDLKQLAFLDKTDSLPQTVEPDPDSQFAEYMQRSLAAIEIQQDATSKSNRQTAVPGASLNTNLPTVSIPNNPNVGVPQATSVLERVYIPVYQQPSRVQPPIQQQPIAGLPSPAVSVSAAPAAPAVPAIAHTLVGLLDLGDQSAALFEVKGTTKRIKVGEAIGSSGWMLVAVANQEAIIRRNGEVRSIYVGQQI